MIHRNIIQFSVGSRHCFLSQRHGMWWCHYYTAPRSPKRLVWHHFKLTREWYKMEDGVGWHLSTLITVWTLKKGFKQKKLPFPVALSTIHFSFRIISSYHFFTLRGPRKAVNFEDSPPEFLVELYPLGKSQGGSLPLGKRGAFISKFSVAKNI